MTVTFNVLLAELESGYRQLEDALWAQRRFVADASHELRTPGLLVSDTDQRRFTRMAHASRRLPFCSV